MRSACCLFLLVCFCFPQIPQTNRILSTSVFYRIFPKQTDSCLLLFSADSPNKQTLVCWHALSLLSEHRLQKSESCGCVMLQRCRITNDTFNCFGWSGCEKPFAKGLVLGILGRFTRENSSAYLTAKLSLPFGNGNRIGQSRRGWQWWGIISNVNDRWMLEG
jgi:hypothetical protein